jgi:iron complex transport system substrate-binding protein
MKEPDFEAISAGAPDLIIISGRTAASYEELSKIAPTIDLSVDQGRPLESFTEQAMKLGEIFGQEDAVADKLDAIDAQIEDTRAKAADAGKGLILLTSGGEATAYGAGSRFGLIHDVLGVPAAADVKSEGPHGESVSFEFVKETNPDLLFVIDRDSAVGTGGAQAAGAVLDNELVKSTNAARNGKIVALDPGSWYLVGYGLNNLPSMVGAVADAL